MGGVGFKGYHRSRRGFGVTGKGVELLGGWHLGLGLGGLTKHRGEGVIGLGGTGLRFTKHIEVLGGRLVGLDGSELRGAGEVGDSESLNLVEQASDCANEVSELVFGEVSRDEHGDDAGEDLGSHFLHPKHFAYFLVNLQHLETDPGIGLLLPHPL